MGEWKADLPRGLGDEDAALQVDASRAVHARCDVGVGDVLHTSHRALPKERAGNKERETGERARVKLDILGGGEE